MIKKGDFYGFHRVIDEVGVLPQGAKKLNNDFSVLYDNEYLIDVEKLNIDAASFKQIKDSVNGDDSLIINKIKEIVSTRGKMHNPVTGSGGVLIGTVKYVGENIKNPKFKSGEKIVTLVSLSLTPLFLEEITSVDKSKDRVFVKGTAALFESGIAGVIDKDIAEDVCMSLLDVAGAAPQAKKLAKEECDVVVLGSGKSGILCLAQVSKIIKKGKIIAIDLFDTNKEFILSSGYATDFIIADAKKPVEVYTKLKEILPNLADVVINTANVTDTEMAAIMCVKDDGTVYFFNMATNFQKAALGAEGIAKDATLIIGNGYAKEHAEITMDLVKNDKVLLNFFERKYS